MNPTSLWKVLLAALALALAGGAAGSLFTLKMVQRTQEKKKPPYTSAATAAPARIEQALTKIQKNLTAELDLDETEAAQVRDELKRTTAELRRARVTATQNTRLILRDATARIAEKLPPEKREKLRRHIEQRLRRIGLEAGPAAAK